MGRSSQQLADFKAEFAKRRKRQLLVSLPVVAAIAVGAIAVAVVLATLVFSLWNWRCPACNKYLGKGISPAFCPKCGVPLQ